MDSFLIGNLSTSPYFCILIVVYVSLYNDYSLQLITLRFILKVFLYVYNLTSYSQYFKPFYLYSRMLFSKFNYFQIIQMHQLVVCNAI